MEISKRNIRRLEGFFYRYGGYITRDSKNIVELMIRRIKLYKDEGLIRYKIYKDDLKAHTEILALILELKIPDDYLRSIAFTQIDKYINNEYSNKKVYIETRDNKKQLNLGSGYRGNVIRYPSKKRSKSHWRNFYNLFPELAEKDNWDGNKSDRHNPEDSKR